MSLASFAYSLSLFWLILHGLQRICHHKWNKNQISILPSNNRSNFWRGSGLRRTREDWNFSVTIRFLQARIETTRWNEIHDKLLTRLKRKREGRGRVWLERVYTFGFGIGVIGMVVVLGILVWTSWSLGRPLVSGVVYNVKDGGSGRLMKRDDVVKMAYGEDSPITPIIPGVTVPLSHIPIILGTLFVSQIIHELGHALAGALYGIPIISSGASIIVCIPAAFVAFSSSSMEGLRSGRKARIVAAGPFHNLVVWCFCIGVGWVVNNGGGGGFLLSALGYRDVSGVGRVVLGVDEASPLAGYLIPGTIVTKLNDHSMVSSDGDSDPWSSFLKSSENDEMQFGWCIDSAELGASSKECCLPDEATSLSCFTASTTPIQLGCLNPVPILTSTDEKARCASEDGCKDGFVCVRPAEKENLLRLSVRSGELEHEEVVLWAGLRGEVYDEVTVGKWLPSILFLPLGLPLWVRIFWEYMLMVNLSLFLFNLLPISGLDGSHLLRSIFATLGERDADKEYDLEAVETGDDPRGRDRIQGGYVEKTISRGAGILVGLDLVLIVLGLFRT